MPLMFENKTTPSSFSVSSAYSNSFSASSILGRGSKARPPKRRGWSETKLACCFVDFARERRGRGAGHEINPGRRNRQHRGFDAVAVHIVQSLGNIPRGYRKPVDAFNARLRHGLTIVVSEKVGVNINQSSSHKSPSSVNRKTAGRRGADFRPHPTQGAFSPVSWMIFFILTKLFFSFSLNCS